MEAGDIDEVIAHLDTIVADAKADRDVLGYFAAMYRAVTRQIKADIDAGEFDDGPRMNRVDTAFANYYLRTYTAHQDSAQLSAPWRLTFDFARRSDPGVFQHLLLGMNADINFDLAQAVADEVASSDLPSFASDYNRINDILFGLLEPLQNAVGVHIRGARLVDLLLGRLEEDFAGWQIAQARSHAWRHAQDLASASHDGQRAAIVRHLERFSTRLAQRRLIPSHRPAAIPWWLARRLEETDVVAIIGSIESVVPQPG